MKNMKTKFNIYPDGGTINYFTITKLNTILAIALPFLLLFILIAITIIFHAPTAYIQSISCGISIFSGLGIFSLVPMKPADDKPRRLSKEEKSQFTLPGELKEIAIGLSLGDLNIQKRQSCVNACLRFEQGMVHSDYLNYLYIKFQDLCPQGP